MNNFIMQPGAGAGNCGYSQTPASVRLQQPRSGFNRSIGGLATGLKTASSARWFNNERQRPVVHMACVPARIAVQRQARAAGRRLATACACYSVRSA